MISSVPTRYYRRFAVYGRNMNNLISSVVLRTPTRVELFAEPPHVVLDQVWTHAEHRGQGYSSELLFMAQREASRHGWPVYCRPVAHDTGPGPNQAELERFYRKRGFVDTAVPPWMRYAPAA